MEDDKLKEGGLASGTDNDAERNSGDVGDSASEKSVKSVVEGGDETKVEDDAHHRGEVSSLSFLCTLFHYSLFDQRV